MITLHYLQPQPPPSTLDTLSTMSNMTYTLWCLVSSDSDPFFVTISPTMSIATLKERIKEKKGALFSGKDASDLTLWKVRHFQWFVLILWVITDVTNGAGLWRMQVDEDFAAVKSEIVSRRYRINTDGKEPLWGVDKILDIWPEPHLRKGTIIKRDYGP